MKQEEIPALIKRVHDNAVKHGWHDELHSTAHCLMMIITEISEMVEADRKNKHADRAGFEANNKPESEENKDIVFQVSFEDYIKESVEDEMADVCIRTLDMAGEYVLNLDLNLLGTYNKFNEEFTYRCYNLVTYLASWDLMDDDEYLTWYLSIILVALSQWAEHDGIDLDWHIKQKMHYNELRPYKHGKKY